VAAELRYGKDLFKGTAEHYDRFRPPYPSVLLDDLRARVPIRDTGRLLDLACGTGQVAFPLAADVGEVWAVDQEAELVDLARRKAQRLGVTNIRWVAAAAEQVALDGTFDLVAVGNAFHRLDRDAVMKHLLPHLPEGGCVALLWGGTPWRGDRPWQRALDEALDRWMDAIGVRDRVPQGWQAAIDRDPHERVLRRAGLDYEGRFEFPCKHHWTVDSLIGFVYSTSFLSRAVLAHHVDVFERDLRVQLLTCCADDRFEADVTFAYELARRPS
jgi:SAM-dependent methyltransferase